MSLTTRIRSEIYEKLVPLLGEENAEAMMAEFPATEHDQLVTREFLRAEMAELRGELKGEVQAVDRGLRAELRSEVGGLETRIRSEIQELRADFQTEFKAVRGEIQAESKAVRGEVHTDIVSLRSEVHDLRTLMTRSLIAIAGITVSAVIGGIGLFAGVG